MTVGAPSGGAPGDPEGMLAAVQALPDALVDSWRRHRSVAPRRAEPPAAVAICGMGGSAIAGDLAARLWGGELEAPVLVVRGEPLPGWVGERTLCILSSYSGNTGETLAAYDAAARRGAQRVAITCGGRLAERAAADAVPLVRLTPGWQPRAALGDSLAAALAVLDGARALPDPGQEIAAAADAMRALRAADVAGAVTEPYVEACAGRLPVIYAPAAIGPVARRWKTQLNENAKTAAAWDELPELHHNAVVGYRLPTAQRDLLLVVLLEASSSGEDMPLGYDPTRELLDDAGIRHVTIVAPAGSLVSQALWLLYLGDLVSVHLALAYGVDPTPVEAIAHVKRRLAGA